MSNELTASEQRTLQAAEEDILDGGDKIVRGLRAIRDGKLYRASYDTFEVYCQKKWNLTDRHVRRLIDHSDVLANIAEMTGPIGPKPDQIGPNRIKEGATREIADLPPETQKQVAKAVKESGKKPTAKAFKEEREKIVPKAEVNGKPPADILNDSLDRPVPRQFRTAYGNGQRMQSVARKLDSILRDVKDIAEGDGGEFLRLQLAPIEEHFKTAKTEIASCAYWTCCPGCDGDGDCNRCKSIGWLPERRKGTLTAKEKEIVGVE